MESLNETLFLSEIGENQDKNNEKKLELLNEKIFEENFNSMTQKPSEIYFITYNEKLEKKEEHNLEYFFQVTKLTNQEEIEIMKLLDFFKDLDPPYTHFSLFTFYMSVICSIFYFYYSYYFINKINEMNFLLKLSSYILNGLSILLLINTRLFIQTHNCKMKNRLIGYFRDSCYIQVTSLNTFLFYHLLILLSFLFHYYIPFYYNIKDFKDSYIIFIRCISIYLYIMHRIYRPSERMDVVRTFLEIEIPEICMDYFDCSEILTLYLETEYETIKLIEFVICGIWLFSIILRFVYLTLIHYPYIFKRLWKHLGCFKFKSEEDSRNFVCLKLRILLLIPTLIGDFLSLLLRLYILLIKGIDQKSFVFALAFKNVSCINRTIKAILDYYRIKKHFFKRDIKEKESCIYKIPIISHFLRCIVNIFENEKLLALISIFICYICYFLIRCLIQLICIELELYYTWIFLGIEILSLIALTFYFLIKPYFTIFHFFHGGLYIIGCFILFDICLVYYPILYFNLNYLPQDHSVISIYNLLTQDCIFILFFLNSIMFNSAMMIQRCYRMEVSSLRSCFLYLIQSSLSNEIILDYTSSMILFLLYQQKYPSLALNIIIIIISILEHCFSGFSIIIINLDSKDSQLDLARIKFILKLMRIFVDSFSLALRIFIGVFYKEVFNIFVFKGICRLLHCLAILERFLFDV